MNLNRTHNVSKVRREWTETPTKRKNESPERDFEKTLQLYAPLFNMLYIKIPDVLPIDKNGKVIKSGEIHISRKLPCDGILLTPAGNYMIECKYQNNALLQHQRAQMFKVNALNMSYYCLRKKVLEKGTIYTVEQNGKTLFKTQDIQDIFTFFVNPKEYTSQEIMKQGMDSMLPSKKRKLRKVRV